jgi:hypothetical protein
MTGTRVPRSLGWLTMVAALAAMSVLAAGLARADAVAYLINVTVRPGYGFASADDALEYGQTVCRRVAETLPYPVLMNDVKADFSTNDEYQASYLISQAVNELCPEQIWQLRRSAIGYRSPAVS